MTDGAAQGADDGVSSPPPETAAWMLADSIVGWQDRQRAAERVREEHERAEAAEQRAHRLEHELEQLRNARPVRLAFEVAEVRERGVKGLGSRLREAAREVELEPLELPEPSPVEQPRGNRRPKPPKRIGYVHPHVRIAHLGATARYAEMAPHHVLAEDHWRAELDAGADMLLLEEGRDERLPALATEAATAARELGIPVVLHSHDPDPELAELADLVRHERPAAEREAHGGVAPTVDERTFNPVGWQPEPPDPVVALVSSPTPDPEAMAALADFDPPVTFVRGPDVPADVLPPGAVHGRGYQDPRGIARAIRRSGVLVDHAGLHADALVSEHLRLAAAACGVPVLALDGDAAGLARPVSPGSEAAEAAHVLLTDPDRLERLSITTRRRALLEHTHRAGFSDLLAALDIRPSAEELVSVVLSTNRPEMVERALAAVARQRHVRCEVVLVQHGDGFEAPVPDVDGVERVVVVAAPARWPLGDCLNAGIDAASGDLVAKMDDDDHYGPDHLIDLVLAQRYSRATLVGKRVDFAHLEGQDTTVRRDRTTPERFRSRASGAAMLMPAATAHRYRFLRLSGRVDSTLCERIVDDGGRIYLTHSRDVIMRRHTEGHTWELDERKMIDQAEDLRPGLALDWASSAPQEGDEAVADVV